MTSGEPSTSDKPVQRAIETKLRAALQPTALSVENESHMHNVPPGSETHFKVIVVSPTFEGKNRVARHREVNKLLAEELAHGVHALSVQAFTPEQFEAISPHDSPACLGGAKREGIGQGS